MEVWVLVLEFLALLGLTGCGAQEEEDVVELTFDDIIGGNQSWDESEIYEEARTNEERQGERATSEALVSCTSALSESETVKMAASGNEILTDVSQLNRNDISREAPFSGCRFSPDKKCTLDISYIEGGAWQEYDENYDMGSGKNALDCNRSYMFCQYGHGIIYLKDAGQTFKDKVEEKAEDELLITLDILQGMVVYDDDGDVSKRTEVNKIKIGVKEIDTYDFKIKVKYQYINQHENLHRKMWMKLTEFCTSMKLIHQTGLRIFWHNVRQNQNWDAYQLKHMMEMIFSKILNIGIMMLVWVINMRMMELYLEELEQFI